MKPLYVPAVPTKPEPLPREKVRHRPKFVNKIADVLIDELRCYRDRRSQLSDEYETIKAKLRYRFTKAELEEVAVFFAATVVEANNVCKITEIRDVQKRK